MEHGYCESCGAALDVDSKVPYCPLCGEVGKAEMVGADYGKHVENEAWERKVWTWEGGGVIRVGVEL